MSTPLDLYAGTGVPLSDRGGTPPFFEPVAELDDPAGYLADEGLKDAVNVSLALGQPLLLTGEPGTGKTQLAASLAHELGFPLFTFSTKTTSLARDLFYRYDTLRHFHDAQFQKGNATAEAYITYEALGLAILAAMPPSQVDDCLPAPMRSRGPGRSVVLIDEIDKAPRDLPNDVLVEIERMIFTVHETGRTFACEPQYRPIVVLTSNSEKNLPDAFLRRCIFYHISFPEGARLRKIVERRLPPDAAFTPGMLENALKHFEEIRAYELKKKPATAELLAWLRVLQRMKIDVAHLKPGEAETLAFTYSIIAKTRDDLDRLQHRAKASPASG